MQTMCHGDPKGANIMYDEEQGISFYDFQWFGKAPPSKEPENLHWKFGSFRKFCCDLVSHHIILHVSGVEDYTTCCFQDLAYFFGVAAHGLSNEENERELLKFYHGELSKLLASEQQTCEITQ